MYQSGTKPQPPMKSGEECACVAAITMSSRLEAERVVGRELGGDLLDAAVVALRAVVPEVALAVDHDEDEVVALAVAQRDGADPEAELFVPGA